MKGMMYINNQDAYEVYGLVMRPGCDEELLKLPKPKPGYEYDWGDENGIETDPDEIPVFERKEYNLPVMLIADNYIDFFSKYTQLAFFLMERSEFNLDVIHLQRRFKVKFKDMTRFDKLTTFQGFGEVASDLILQLTDDYPDEIFNRGVPDAPYLNEITLNVSDHPILTWVEGSTGETPKTGNKIQRRLLNGSYSDIAEINGSYQTTFTDTTALIGNIYQYRVATKNSAGYGVWSNMQQVTVGDLPLSPPNIYVQSTGVGENTITVF